MARMTFIIRRVLIIVYCNCNGNGKKIIIGIDTARNECGRWLSTLNGIMDIKCMKSAFVLTRSIYIHESPPIYIYICIMV